MKCPVCNHDIKAWDWRQNCKHCGTNLFLHDFNKRLEQDSVQAEKDFQWWTNMSNQFMSYGVRDKFALTRLICSVLALVILPLPLCSANGKPAMFISFMLDVFGGGSILPEGFSTGDIFKYPGMGAGFLMLLASLVFAFITFLAVVIGPAFMKFKEACVFELIAFVLAVAGTIVFNFVFLPNGAELGLTSSFGMYIYCGVMTGEAVLMLTFTKYSKKFKPLM